jgi:hypothetical protein
VVRGRSASAASLRHSRAEDPFSNAKDLGLARTKSAQACAEKHPVTGGWLLWRAP